VRVRHPTEGTTGKRTESGVVDLLHVAIWKRFPNASRTNSDSRVTNDHPR